MLASGTGRTTARLGTAKSRVRENDRPSSEAQSVGQQLRVAVRGARGRDDNTARGGDGISQEVKHLTQKIEAEESQEVAELAEIKEKLRSKKSSQRPRNKKKLQEKRKR